MSHIDQKVIIVTGAGGGFGRLMAAKAAAAGARIVCADIDQAELSRTVDQVNGAGGQSVGVHTDVTDIGAMKALAVAAVAEYGRIDVMINNAGIMPLAFFADHEQAAEAWHRCIDINFKGVLNGMIAVHDQMISQACGHVINISSIYGNFPVSGAAVYGATKAAVNFLSESLRVEARGKIKITTVKPTGIPVTGLSSTVINPKAVVGIVGQNGEEFVDLIGKLQNGAVEIDNLDPDKIDYLILDPVLLVDQVLHVINQPVGVSVSDITVRASGDHYIL